ncbi:glycosyltransferase family 4 protein [Pullulanibacillus sp. KACC 23026]|uniref:glycosyltransferase family 4 protein n=1 Tax=Pullulanibacillus sp. KACC 23026 TaxID=3028315 RepID=UPI0023AFBC97|nr:glycosyltransferase family 4 protein [Pullulanibacillus sp. KACC 23026]WEG11521.1 glycosyltransferase family 4 protein [Pullulanibacillus sp. KACC 23026]
MPLYQEVSEGLQEKKRVLFCATVDYHFQKFHLQILKWFHDQGWEVHIAAYGDMELPFVNVRHHLMVSRSPFRTKNVNAYLKLKEIIQTYRFQIIHCHTPMGGVLTRLAARFVRKQGSSVLYTVHGFHFYKKAPIMNWIIYYPIEKWLSRFTDVLITINEEDYLLSRAKKFKANHILKVNGVGVDTGLYRPLLNGEKKLLKVSLGFQPKDSLLFYAAEFNANKNQQFLIEVLSYLHQELPHVHLLLAGDGKLLEACQKQAVERRLGDRVHFLGYQNDVLPFLQMSDIAVASSYREGLPVNIMEAMSCGLPVVATDNRGHRELVQHESSGYLVDHSSPLKMAEALKTLILNPKVGRQFGKVGREQILLRYSKELIMEAHQSIYNDLIEKGVRAWRKPH